MLEEDIYGYVIRSRFQGNAAHERASLYHASKEVKNGKSNNITTLRMGANTISDGDIIKGNIFSYFNSLFNGFHNKDLVVTNQSFTPDDSHLDYFLDRLVSLSDEDRDDMVQDMDRT